MTIRHHVSNELLARYAAGHLPEAVALFVRSHAALCSECLELMLTFEDVCGEMLIENESEPVGSTLFDSILNRIKNDETSDPSVVHLSSSKVADTTDESVDSIIPEPIRAYLDAPFEKLSWRRALPGAREYLLPINLGGMPVRLARLSSFVRIPLHAHKAPEYTLILAGGLEDEHGIYERGDVHVYDSQDQHSQRVLPGGECVCMVVNSERLVQLTLAGRVFAKLTGV